MSRRRLGTAQGAYNILSGLWPLLSMRTFEGVYGAKRDKWLVCTVGGLLCTVGAAQLVSSRSHGDRVAAVLGVGTAATLVAVDLVNVPRGRISRMYLADAACEMTFLVAWATTGRRVSS